MKVFALFSPDKAALVRVWARSWAARGWRPQVLTEREVREAGSPRKAARARGGGVLTDLQVINFGYRRGGKKARKTHGKPGWESADLVVFPASFTEQDVRDARPL